MPALSDSIQLIVGLGNPGKQYVNTRHNAGQWWVEQLAHHYRTTLRPDTKFKGLYANADHQQQRLHLLIPTTFMNLSGQAVIAVSRFYHIDPRQILIAHDELDLAVGDIRLKFGGGHGGHNGLKDIAAHLHTNDFYRLRIGIAHPGERHLVHDYVLSPPNTHDKQQINQAFTRADAIVPYLLEGQPEKAMQILHTR